MRFRLLGLLAAATFVAASFAQGAAQSTATSAPFTPPPAVLTPVRAATSPPATPTPGPGRRAPDKTPAPKGSPVDTPAPPQFSTLDGVWEVEMQTPRKTIYSHLTLAQSGSGGTDIRGTWDRDKQKLPLTGTFDGRLFTLSVVDGSKTITFSGYAENFSDLVGMIADGPVQTAFTAQHRKKDKLLNLTPGVPGGGGGGGGGSGGRY